MLKGGEAGPVLYDLHIVHVRGCLSRAREGDRVSEAETLGGVTAAQWTPAGGGGIKQGRAPPKRTE